MPDLPAVPETTFTERIGVNYIGLVASQMEMIFREISNTDLGIDGYLEVVVNGAPIGLIAVQIKSGSSYIESPNDTSFIFRAQKKHVRYWLSYRLPVIVAVYDPEEKVAYWHYIQDYFSENDDIPEIDSVPIRVSKTSLFDSSNKDRLIEIASLPDSTAHAMLALRASRYGVTKELLTPIEMIELYGKRKWLGEWLPLDEAREEILLHSGLGDKGPSWYWFREGANRDFIPYLRSALDHPEFLVRQEASLALAVALGRGAVPDLCRLINQDNNVGSVAETLASIPDLTEEDRVEITDALWAHLERVTDQPRAEVHEILSSIALVGREQSRERVVEAYQHLVGYTAPSVWPVLLRSAGCLWNVSDLTELRDIAHSDDHIMATLAITALAHLGERQDLEMLVAATQSGSWVGVSNDRSWLSEKIARLFTVEDLEWLQELLSSGYEQEWAARRALRYLSPQFDEETLLDMLNQPNSDIQEYAILGLVARGSQSELRNYQHLMPDDNPTLASRLAMGLTAIGDWDLIDELMQSANYGVREGVAIGLRFVSDGPVFEYLFEILQDSDFYLLASKSLVKIGDEEALNSLVKWVLENPYQRHAEVVRDIIRHLDHKLYCSVQWSMNINRDFTSRRYSILRYEARSFESDMFD